MDNRVIVSKGKDPYTTTRKALGQLPLPDLAGRKVLIKPNAGRIASPGAGITTHPDVVSAVIDHLREKGAKDPAIGESCIFGVNAVEAFSSTGMKEVSERARVALIDLDQGNPWDIDLPDGRVLKKIRVSAILKHFDFIVSVPVMKTHMHTRATLSIKNMKGVLWRREKARLHQLRSNRKFAQGEKELDVAISEMASVLRPDLAVIDGTVGMEGMGPAYGHSKKMGIVVVSDRAFSADAVAARLMGLDPERVPHLRLSAEKGLGEIRLKKMSITPKDYLKWENPFALPPTQLSIPYPNVAVHDEGSCSACLSTLLVFLQDHHSALTDYRLKDGKVHVGIGKHLSVCPNGTILIGNCAARKKGKGAFIQGCPPVASQIWDTLSKGYSKRIS
jgi:uncharacterized protein (DUF362 family)